MQGRGLTRGGEADSGKGLTWGGSPRSLEVRWCQRLQSQGVEPPRVNLPALLRPEASV